MWAPNRPQHCSNADAAMRPGEMPLNEARSLKSLRKEMRKMLRRVSRSSCREHLSSVIDTAGKTKQVWRAIASVKGNRSVAQTGDECTWQGQSYSGLTNVQAAMTQRMRQIHQHDPQKPCDEAFFKKIEQALPDILAHDDPECAKLNLPFTRAEFESVIKKLANRDSKSTGPDGIHYWMIRRGGKKLHAVLLKLLNTMWEWEVIPPQWLEANVRYLHKGNNKPVLDLDSYRPISLLSCLGKFFTMMWLARLTPVLRDKIGCDQAGGVPNAGAIEAFWTLKRLLANSTRKKPPTKPMSFSATWKRRLMGSGEVDFSSSCTPMV